MKSIRKRIVTVSFVLLLCYMVLTPIGALRTDVFIWSPVDAILLQVKVATAAEAGCSKLDTPKNTTVYRIVSHVPYAKATDTDMYNWKVSKHGIFYTAKYYGWC